MLVAIAAVVVNTTLAIVLVGPLGLRGIALAIAIAAWLEATALLLVILRMRVAGLRLRGPVARCGPGPRRNRRRLGARLRHRGADRTGDRSGSVRRRADGFDVVATIGGLWRRLRRCRGRVADPGAGVYRRGHGRSGSAPVPVVTSAETADWDAFVEASDPGSYLQLSGWAYGQGGERLVGPPARRPIGAVSGDPGPVPAPDRRPDPGSPATSDALGVRVCPARAGGAGRGHPKTIGAFTATVRDTLPRSAGRVSHLRIDPGSGAGRAARRRWGAAALPSARRDGDPAPAIQPNATRIIDLRAGRGRLGASSARSGGNTSTRPGPGGSRSSTAIGRGCPSSTESTGRPPTGQGS